METYSVKISTPGQMIIFRGKRARTPVRFEKVHKEEIGLLENQCRRSLLKYEIYKEGKVNEVSDDLIEVDLTEKVEESKSEPDLEEYIGEPKSILDRLAFDLD